MAEEYILKVKNIDEIELIPKQQWDGNLNTDILGFILLGPGLYREIVKNSKNKTETIEYPTYIGIIYDLNKKDDKGYLVAIYEYDKGKYGYEYIRKIDSALKHEVPTVLEKDVEWNEIKLRIELTYKIDIEYAEFEKIVKSVILGNLLYNEMKKLGIKPLFDLKQYYFILYKYALNGKFDYITYLKVIDPEDLLIKIDTKHALEFKERYEEAYRKVINNQQNNGL
jgi:hypothetical protein